MIGQKFDRLTIIKEALRDKGGRKRWFCNCSCGKNLIIVDNWKLKNGYTKSCGCLRSTRTREVKTTHGLSKTKTYRTWFSLIDRCRREKSTKYYLYGGRGITVCKRWFKFENFLKDMGMKPKGLTIDRINNEKGYSPENCRWVTNIQQSNNRRTTRFFIFNNERNSVRGFSEKYNLPFSTITQRIRRGWSIEKTLTTPKLVHCYG